MTAIILRLALGGWGFLKGLPSWVWYVIAALALALFGWHLIAVRDRHIWNAGWNAEYQAAYAREAIQRRSIADLEAIIAGKNAETEVRAKAYADTKADDARDTAAMAARAKAAEGQAATLQALAHDLPVNPACKVPGALAGALEGL